MALIHPTAIVDPKAEIAEGVEIGPYAVIGPNVKIGAKTQIGAHTVVEGCTTIGQENKIGHFASVGGAPQDMKYRGEPTQLIIGDRNMIREFTTLHTGTIQDQGITKIGNDNWIMAYVHIAHDCVVGNNTIFSNNAQIAGHVHVDDHQRVAGLYYENESKNPDPDRGLSVWSGTFRDWTRGTEQGSPFDRWSNC